ncbi:hypothetical protein ABEB36_004461 [Hypothenemus hampei]|uniref:Prostaglandin reductase 1 n=1 Tax=Hypothenemus hampei TaxID=57062 RepID=A0ABD1F3G3_HYPHA
MVIAKKWVVVQASKGFPKISDFKLEEEKLRPIEDGEFLVEAVYLSVDPYMRAYMSRLPKNSTMIGGQIAKIIESKAPEFPTGKYIYSSTGWRTHSIINSKQLSDDMGLLTIILPDFGNLPLSLGLGILGMPGNSAYFGFLEICKPKQGETVVVSGAAGAVGSHVVQIAKIKGCTVIGIAGSDEKGKWLTEELGLDYFINYKTQNIEEELKKAAPNGVDCYFDNVGGEISTTILNQMKTFGRVSICGSISGYNATEVQKISSPYFTIVTKQLTLQGFIFSTWNHQWFEGIHANLKWIQEEKLKYRETVTEGFDNMFTAFTDMLQGKNLGKAVVKV